VIDSHCHLAITAEYSGLSPADALAAAAAVGVGGVVEVGVDLPSSRQAVALAAEHDGVVAAVALHPNEAPAVAAAGELEQQLAELAVLAADPRTVAIGETGLDHYRTDESGRGAQEESFRRHIELARATGRTLVIHDRDAHSDVLRVLESAGAPPRVVFHCFSGDAAMARVCSEAGWFLSFAGVVTFRNAGAVSAALGQAAPEQVLVETDAPFLTPVPHRGKPNASYLMPWTVRFIAQQWSLPLDEACHLLRRNTQRAFALPAGFGG
jgi:TatD DNase family protein